MIFHSFIKKKTKHNTIQVNQTVSKALKLEYHI